MVLAHPVEQHLDVYVLTERISLDAHMHSILVFQIHVGTEELVLDSLALIIGALVRHHLLETSALLKEVNVVAS